MIGFYALLLLVITACNPDLKDDIRENEAHVLVSQEMAIESQASISIDIGLLGSSAKELEKKIYLVATPQDETLELKHLTQAEAYSLKPMEKGRIYSLTPKKKLKEGQHYGLFLRPDGSEVAQLAQVFLVKYERPQLIKHDLGSGPLPAVPKNRRVFTFDFDQPIRVLEDDALKLQGKERNLVIESIRIPFNESQIIVVIAPDQLRIGEHYAWSFGAIFNKDKKPAVIKPLPFMVSDAKEALSEQSPLNIAVSHDSAEISWPLDQDHLSELFYGKDTGFHDCLGTACPKTSRAILAMNAEDTNSSLSRFYVTKLSPNAVYHLVMRSMDLQGQILLGALSFKTLSGPSIRFSEIMIHPNVPSGKKENTGEFIELYNASEQATLIEDLSLVLESVDGASRRECMVVEPKKPLALAPKSYFLVVGQDFDASLWSLPAASVLVRLPKKKLCGGLPNGRAFIIKVLGAKGSLLDRFGAYLWQGKAGSSIVRRDALLADEASSYGFSGAEGPSPGSKNELLSTCEVSEGPR